MKPEIEKFIAKHEKWQEGLIVLHETIMQHGYEATIKWGAPTYVANGQNVIGLGAFKHHFGVWFFQGALLKDKAKVLVNAQEKTKALRQLKYKAVDEIDLKIVSAYAKEAKANAEAGKEVPKAKPNTKKVETPDLLQEKLNTDLELKEAFKALPPYKRKEYKLHILDAKREATKISRLEKIIPMIKAGVGLNDKYKNC